jgi:hypothetical protein
MTNDLKTMRERLRQQLSDVDDATWDAGEKDDLLAWGIRRLNNKVPRPLDPETSTYQVTLVADTYWYSIPAAMNSIERVTIHDADGDEVGRITAWESTGDIISGTGKIHVAPSLVEGYVGGTVWLYGTGRYDLVTSLLPDDYVAALLAIARAEALRRLITDRARFKQWQVANQVQNISVNELIQTVNEADRAAAEEVALLKRWQMPVTARLDQ